jgi:hypothetical protein
MTDAERTRQARAFVDSIVELNRKYGDAVRLPRDRYNEAVSEAAAAFRGLRDSSGQQAKSRSAVRSKSNR